MTLELNLKNVKDSSGGKFKPSYIYVEGSQSGSLRLQVNKLPQKIKCSIKDHLIFVFCGSKSVEEPQTGDVIAKKDFWAESFIDQNQYSDELQKYILQYFNSKHQKQGQIVCDIKYTRGLFYQGQISGASTNRKKFVPLYKGKCPTFNLYNFLDSKQGLLNFNIIESVYQDE